MSKHQRQKYPRPGRGVGAPSVADLFVLQVLERAQQAGAKAGSKAVRKALKYADTPGFELSPEQREQLRVAAARAGAAAALLEARNLLHGSALHAPHSEGEPAEAPVATAPESDQPRVAPAQGKGQHVLEIRRSEQLSPQMLRIIAGAPQLDGFQPNTKADQYVKVYFADPQLGLEPPYDIKALRQHLPRHLVPRSRSYTIRWVDRAAQELAIDFVLHDQPGSAGEWAQAARPGDRLVISAARGKFSPDPDSRYFLLGADETAIPAVSRALAALPETAQGVALLEVAGPQGELQIPHPAGVELRWLHRNGQPPGTTDLLAEAFLKLPTPPPQSTVIAHGERSAAKAISRIVAGWGLDRKRVHVSSYWTLPTRSR